MDTSVIELLCQRVSSPRLTEPAPSEQELDTIFKAALRAPDHMRLRPWRYLVIEGEAREKLGQLFVDASETIALSKHQDLEDCKRQKCQSMPLRAPTIVVAIASLKEHPKVPSEEQVISCGVGVGYMLLALQALGYGGVWRTGDMATNTHVRNGLGLSTSESIVGFLYLGTPAGDLKCVPDLDVKDFVTSWA